MIEVVKLKKYFGDYAAIDDISFTIGKGEIVGFLGPNGAGKTTTMRILSTYLLPSSGNARVAGFDVVRNPLEVRRRIGYVPENPPLYLDKTVDDFLGFMGRLKGLYGKALKREKSRAMERCFLGQVRKRLIGNLSRGYRQRVAIANGIIHNPEVLIFDEPTAGLDPQQIREIRELIRSFAREHTILLSTHILPEVSMTCGRVIIINRGKIVVQDTLENLTSGAKESLEDVFLKLIAEERGEEEREQRI
ncbi:MAG: ATP-binding cassette domain-containing protein [Acidobacteriota bacterium]